MICTLCPRNCGAERAPERGTGVCRMGTLPKIARAALHRWEEPCISGTRGSGAVFFSGCGLRCVFCQNESISQRGDGKIVTPKRLSEIFRELEAQGKLTIYRMPDEDLDKIQEVAQEYYEEKCAANPLFEKIYRSQQAYIASVSDWSEAATAK